MYIKTSLFFTSPASSVLKQIGTVKYWNRMRAIFNCPVILLANARICPSHPTPNHRFTPIFHVEFPCILPINWPTHSKLLFFNFLKIARHVTCHISAVQQTVQSSRCVPKIRCTRHIHSSVICIQSSVNIGCSVGVRAAVAAFVVRARKSARVWYWISAVDDDCSVCACVCMRSESNGW